MYRDKRTKDVLALEHRLACASTFMAFNQNLVQFADAKANGLLLVNSIFLASMIPALETVRREAGHPTAKMVSLAFFVTCVLALLVSLRVTLARARKPDEPRGRSLHFHKDVASHPNASGYVEEFRDAEGERVLDAMLASTYDLASIARSKFDAYRHAERLTLLAACLWIAGMVLVVAE